MRSCRAHSLAKLPTVFPSDKHPQHFLLQQVCQQGCPLPRQVQICCSPSTSQARHHQCWARCTCWCGAGTCRWSCSGTTPAAWTRRTCLRWGPPCWSWPLPGPCHQVFTQISNLTSRAMPFSSSMLLLVAELASSSSPASPLGSRIVHTSNSNGRPHHVTSHAGMLPDLVLQWQLPCCQLLHAVSPNSAAMHHLCLLARAT